jgi:PAS domain S-box-containing protein
MLEISKQILIDLDSDFEIDSACCVGEAFKKLSTGQYDVVISDYEMPQKNGLQFLKELREGKNEIPFILFTGKGREEVVIQALNLGADHYVNKYGSPETVYSELAHLVSSAVEKSRAKLRNENDSLALHNVHDAIVSSDTNFIITAWNKAAEELFGFDSTEVLQKKIDDVFQKIQVKPSYEEIILQLKTTGKFQGEIVYQNKNGQKRDGELKIISIVLENGKFLGNVAVCSDITERKKAEEKLKASEEKYQTTFKASTDALMLLDEKGFFDCNRSTLELFGCRSVEEFTAFHPADLSPPNQTDGIPSINAAMSHIQKAFQIGADHFFWIHKRKDDAVFPADVLLTRMTLKGREVLQATVRDITNQKKTEEALRKSEERYRELVNCVPEMVFECDLTGKITYISQRTFDFTGFTNEDLEGRNMLDFLVPDDRKRAVENMKRSFAGENLGSTEYSLFRKDGTTYPTLVRTSRIISENKVIGLRGIVIEITELKKAEEALRKSEERFRHLLLSSPDTVHLLDPISHKVELLNRDEFLGYSRSELEGANSILTWLHPNDGQLMQSYYQLVLKGTPDGQKPIEYRLKNKAGSWEWVRSRATIVRYDEQGKPSQILVTLTVITEQKKVEESLKESEEKFRNLSEESPNVIFINKEGRVLYANKKSEDLTGYTREDLYSPSFNFLSLCAPEYVEVMKSSYTKHMRGDDAPPYDYVLISKSGKRIDVMITSKLINFDGKKAILGIVTDISELKKAQETLNRTMNELVSVNEKLGVVGRLTRHDIRNKLSAITCYTYLLKKKHKDQADIVEALGKIEQAVRDSVKIFDFAKMYEQIGVEELSYVDVGKAVEEASALFSGLTIKVVNGCHGRSVLADSFLRQMFYNFIDNTRKYGVKATTIKVYCEQEDSDGVRLIYEDDGVGISTENKSKLFKEGFSTGGSTGFGLFLIKKMIEVYGWTISEEGEPGKGAKFILTIP